MIVEVAVIVIVIVPVIALGNGNDTVVVIDTDDHGSIRLVSDALRNRLGRAPKLLLAH